MHSSVAHAKGEWKRGDGHTNGVENFWRQTKRRLFLNNGQYLRRFEEFLGEAVWLYNHREDPSGELRRLIRERGRARTFGRRRFRNGFLFVAP